MKKRILILFAHPRFEQSKTNRALVDAIPKSENITFNDLYEHYADFNIDIEREKKLLAEHDVVIWHHPFYWYSSPPLLKQWIDMVLEFGWAYGPGGGALEGKCAFNVITSGGPKEAYGKQGRNRFEISEFLSPFNQTATLCKMTYLNHFWLSGTHKLSAEELENCGKDYAIVLNTLQNGDFNPQEVQKQGSLNNWVSSIKQVES